VEAQMKDFDILRGYREMAEGGHQFRGLTLLNNVDEIASYALKHGCRTMLDYGSGAGDAYMAPHNAANKLGMSRDVIRCYDPSFAEHATLPMGTFDLVVCSDVLEHIPQENVSTFIANLFSYADNLVWASVCCRPAKKVFPGTSINLHCTVMPFQWWQAMFEAQAVPGVEWVLREAP
jgi:hypothetical protein